MELTFEEVKRQVEKIADGDHCSFYYCSSKQQGKKVREYNIYYKFEDHKGSSWSTALKKLKSSIKKS